MAISTGNLYELSSKQVTACAPNPLHCGGTGGCYGSTQELAFNYTQYSKGLYLDSHYPYPETQIGCNTPAGVNPIVTIDGYITLPQNNYTVLMNVLANVGPVTISVAASSWFSYKSGVFSGCGADWVINHAVQLVGYNVTATGEKYWYVVFTILYVCCTVLARFLMFLYLLHLCLFI